MKVEIVKEKQNPFLKRLEIVVAIDHTKETTPKKMELQQWISKEKKKDVTSVEIIDIVSESGKPIATANVYIWDEKKVDDLSKIKKEKKEEAPKEEAPKEEDKKEEKSE